MDKLRATFIAGPATGVTAQETFTNRVSEFEAFQHAVREVATANAAGVPRSLDLSAARRNVLVFYGLGGIGKTALSKQLERSFGQDDFGADLPSTRVSARVDFGEAGDVDLETMLLNIRGRLGALSRK